MGSPTVQYHTGTIYNVVTISTPYGIAYSRKKCSSHLKPETSNNITTYKKFTSIEYWIRYNRDCFVIIILGLVKEGFQYMSMAFKKYQLDHKILIDAHVYIWILLLLQLALAENDIVK